MSILPSIAEALLNSQAYPHKPRKIELVQTQMSFLFLTGDYVYKVKKPVNLGYLDYTTLEKRRFFCHQELELNRRLCPEVYLAVAPIVEYKGALHIEGEGKTVEYAVKMKQLPRDHMMDVLLPRGQVSQEMVTKVAEKLVSFHQRAETNPEIAAFGKLGVIRQNTDENFAQTERYVGVSIPSTEYNRIENYTDDFMQSNASLFNKRIREGKIRDCHGDLHAAHVCFTDDICIYDCIEFNDRFRYSDVASEIAFLAMDLDRYQQADLSNHLVNTYVELSHDEELLKLLNFYKCYRAYVRGKVESFKLDDPYLTEEEKKASLATAESYFDLACSYARAKPLVIITTGLVGTGKTTVAEALSQRLGCATISSDVIRKKLANISPTEHRFEEFQGGIYSADFSAKTYSEMFQQADKILSQGQSVILDATFGRKEDRLQAKKLAEERGADFVVLECLLDEENTKRRLEERLKGETTSDGRWEIFEFQKQRFDPVTEIAPQQHVVLDTSQPIDNIIEIIRSRLCSG